MKTITIKSLELSDWKAQNRKVEFKEHNNSISGRNKAGKTTLFKAWCWLLTGYESPNNGKNSDLFDNKVELSPDTPKASVKAVILIDNREYVVERTAQSKWVRKRGTNEYVKNSSDEYRYYIDEIEFNATDFDKWITDNLADASLIKYAVSGEFFINAIYDDKKVARKIIENLIGEVKDDEMVGDYPIINELKDKYTIDQIEQQSINMCKAINARLDELPIKLKAKNAEVEDLMKVDYESIEKEIAGKEEEYNGLEKQLFDIAERYKPLLEQKHVAEQSRAMIQDVFDIAKKEYYAKWTAKDNELCIAISKGEETNRNNAIQREKLTQFIAKFNSNIAETEKVLQKLREKRDEIKARTFSVATCPLCGAELPEEKQSELRLKWEYDNHVELESVVAKGRSLANELSATKEKLADTQKRLSEINDVDVDALHNELMELRKCDIPAFEDTERGREIMAQFDEIKVPDVQIPDNRKIADKKDAIRIYLKELYGRLSGKQRLEYLQKEIDDIKIEQRQQGEQLSRYEQQRIEVKQYRQEQMNILSQKVNVGLKSSSIDIWSKQKDGTIVPDLVLKDAQGVQYATTNNASRIITAIDVQRLFCNILGVNMPTWVDESSVLNKDNIPQLDGTQMFFLFCSEDRVLKIISE